MQCRFLSPNLDEIYRRGRTEAEIERHEQHFCGEVAARQMA
jgi:hypothetical protein